MSFFSSGPKGLQVTGQTNFPGLGLASHLAGPPGLSGTNTIGSNTTAPAPPLFPPLPIGLSSSLSQLLANMPPPAHANNTINNNARHASDSEDFDSGFDGYDFDDDNHDMYVFDFGDEGSDHEN
jgi:hypothetical protein